MWALDNLGTINLGTGLFQAPLKAESQVNVVCSLGSLAQDLVDLFNLEYTFCVDIKHDPTTPLGAQHT